MTGRRGLAAKQMQVKQQVVVPEPMEEEPTRKRPWEKLDADARKTMLV